jgi:hypothetical protein
MLGASRGRLASVVIDELLTYLKLSEHRLGFLVI